MAFLPSSAGRGKRLPLKLHISQCRRPERLLLPPKSKASLSAFSCPCGIWVRNPPWFRSTAQFAFSPQRVSSENHRHERPVDAPIRPSNDPGTRTDPECPAHTNSWKSLHNPMGRFPSFRSFRYTLTHKETETKDGRKVQTAMCEPSGCSNTLLFTTRTTPPPKAAVLVTQPHKLNPAETDGRWG